MIDTGEQMIDKDMEMIDSSMFPLINVAKEGQYFYPASSRYKQKQNAIVSCDNCLAENLIACVSKDEYDLCLKCVDKLLKKITNKRVMVKNSDEYMFLMY